jgi:hypothetical protein
MQKSKTGSKLQEHQGEKTHSEDVGKLQAHRDMRDVDISDSNMLTDEVNVNFDMLCVLMLEGVDRKVDRVDRKADGAGVIAVD